MVVHPIFHRVLYIPGGCLGFLNHQQYVGKFPYGLLDGNHFRTSNLPSSKLPLHPRQAYELVPQDSCHPRSGSQRDGNLRVPTPREIAGPKKALFNGQSPLIRPAISWGYHVALGGGPLDSYDVFEKFASFSREFKGSSNFQPSSFEGHF